MENCLENLLKILAQLDGKEETWLFLKLHLLNDPARFIISRLLDPHCLEYTWPFGGLVFSFSVLSEDFDDELMNDHIFFEDVTLFGAGWNNSESCLTDEGTMAKLWKIRGIPIDKKNVLVSTELVDIPVYSCYHSGELFRVPLNVGKKSKDFWERKNVFLRLGTKIL